MGLFYQLLCCPLRHCCHVCYREERSRISCKRETFSCIISWCTCIFSQKIYIWSENNLGEKEMCNIFLPLIQTWTHRQRHIDGDMEGGGRSGRQLQQVPWDGLCCVVRHVPHPENVQHWQTLYFPAVSIALLPLGTPYRWHWGPSVCRK